MPDGMTRFKIRSKRKMKGDGMRIKAFLIVFILWLSVCAQAGDRLYAFQLWADGYQYVCQMTPESQDSNVESGYAVFWKVGTADNWTFRYEDNGITVHMAGMPGFFIHMGSNGLIYSPPGTFTMFLQ